MRIGEIRQFRWLEGIITAIFILNVMDGILTLIWYFAGYADEANPLMVHLIERSPLLFMLTKLVLVSLGSILLWRYRTRGLAVVAIIFLFLVYYAILIFHLQAMNLDIVVDWIQRS